MVFPGGICGGICGGFVGFWAAGERFGGHGADGALVAVELEELVEVLD
jgi:hypothetical protein